MTHTKMQTFNRVRTTLLALAMLTQCTLAVAQDFIGLKGIYPSMTVDALHGQVRESFGISQAPLCSPPQWRGVGILTQTCDWILENPQTRLTYANLPVVGIGYSLRGIDVVEVTLHIRAVSPNMAQLETALRELLGPPLFDGKWDMSWIAVGPKRNWNVDYSRDTGAISVIDRATSLALQEALKDARERAVRVKRKDM